MTMRENASRHAAMASGCACDRRLRSVDFPAFGFPISPTSAISFSSSVTKRY